MHHDDKSTRRRQRRPSPGGGLLAAGATAVVAAVTGIFMFGGAGGSLEVVDTAAAVPANALAGGVPELSPTIMTGSVAPHRARRTTRPHKSKSKRARRGSTRSKHEPSPQIPTSKSTRTADPAQPGNPPTTSKPTPTKTAITPEPEITVPSGKPQPEATPTTGKPQPETTPTTGKPQPETTGKPQPETPAGGTAAQQIVSLANAERAKAGCDPLRVDNRLQAAAQAHADDMAARNYYEHDNPEGQNAGDRMAAAGYGWRRWGENIHRGPKDPATAMRDWMNSSGHRANILDCRFKDIGVGVNVSANGPWWVQNFGTSS